MYPVALPGVFERNRIVSAARAGLASRTSPDGCGGLAELTALGGLAGVRVNVYDAGERKWMALHDAGRTDVYVMYTPAPTRCGPDTAAVGHYQGLWYTDTTTRGPHAATPKPRAEPCDVPDPDDTNAHDADNADQAKAHDRFIDDLLKTVPHRKGRALYELTEAEYKEYLRALYARGPYTTPVHRFCKACHDRLDADVPTGKFQPLLVGYTCWICKHKTDQRNGGEQRGLEGESREQIADWAKAWPDLGATS